MPRSSALRPIVPCYLLRLFPVAPPQPRHNPLQDRLGDLILAHQRPGLAVAVALEQRDPVGVHGKAAVRRGHVVEDDQIEILARQFVEGIGFQIIRLRGKADYQLRSLPLSPPLLADRLQNVRRPFECNNLLLRRLFQLLVGAVGRDDSRPPRPRR